MSHIHKIYDLGRNSIAISLKLGSYIIDNYLHPPLTFEGGTRQIRVVVNFISSYLKHDMKSPHMDFIDYRPRKPPWNTSNSSMKLILRNYQIISPLIPCLEVLKLSRNFLIHSILFQSSDFIIAHKSQCNLQSRHQEFLSRPKLGKLNKILSFLSWDLMRTSANSHVNSYSQTSTSKLVGGRIHYDDIIEQSHLFKGSNNQISSRISKILSSYHLRHYQGIVNIFRLPFYANKITWFKTSQIHTKSILTRPRQLTTIARKQHQHRSTLYLIVQTQCAHLGDDLISYIDDRIQP